VNKNFPFMSGLPESAGSGKGGAYTHKDVLRFTKPNNAEYTYDTLK
jgi:hypothetical protein